MWVVPIPLSIQVSSKKKFYVNLNQYRNTHFHVLNKAKRDYHLLVQNLLRKLGVPRLNKVELLFTVFPSTKVLMDTSNICCIAEKFFCDAMVTSGRIPDDNFNHVIRTTYEYGYVDSINPRIEVTIIPSGDALTKGVNTMKIILSNEEVMAALQEHINNMIQISDDTDVSLEMNEDGSVEVILTKDGEEQEDHQQTAAKKTTRRKRRTKAEIEADKAVEAAPKETPQEPVKEEAQKAPAADLSGPGSLFPDNDGEEEDTPSQEQEEEDTTFEDASDLFKDH